MRVVLFNGPRFHFTFSLKYFNLIPSLVKKVKLRTTFYIHNKTMKSFFFEIIIVIYCQCILHLACTIMEQTKTGISVTRVIRARLKTLCQLLHYANIIVNQHKHFGEIKKKPTLS